MDKEKEELKSFNLKELKKDYKVECPKCKIRLTGISANGDNLPTEGDVSACVYCGQMLKIKLNTDGGYIYEKAVDSDIKYEDKQDFKRYLYEEVNKFRESRGLNQFKAILIDPSDPNFDIKKVMQEFDDAIDDMTSADGKSPNLSILGISIPNKK